jgi:hypothetical protein
MNSGFRIASKSNSLKGGKPYGVKIRFSSKCAVLLMLTTEKQRAQTAKTRVFDDLHRVLCFDMEFARPFGTRGYA